MDGLIGGIIFEFLGASVKWSFQYIKCPFTGKEIKGFREIYQGDKNTNDYDVVMLSLSNKAVGIIFIMLLVCIILYLNL